MKNREDNSQYCEILLLYLSGLLKEEENIRLSNILEINTLLKCETENLEQILIALSEKYGNALPKNMRNNILGIVISP